MRLYIRRYMYPMRFILLDSLARYVRIVRYGHPVHGSKNKLISIPMKNAHAGEVIFRIHFLLAILKLSGISVEKSFPYQK